MIEQGVALNFDGQLVMSIFPSHLDVHVKDPQDEVNLASWGRFAADSLWPSLETNAEGLSFETAEWSVTLDANEGTCTFTPTPSMDRSDSWIHEFFIVMAQRLKELKESQGETRE